MIQNGDLLEECEDPNEFDFMPSSRAKHRAPRNMDVGIQEKLKEKPAVSTTRKKSLPDRTGRGYNPHYNTGEKQKATRAPSQVPND